VLKSPPISAGPSRSASSASSNIRICRRRWPRLECASRCTLAHRSGPVGNSTVPSATACEPIRFSLPRILSFPFTSRTEAASRIGQRENSALP